MQTTTYNNTTYNNIDFLRFYECWNGTAWNRNKRRATECDLQSASLRSRLNTDVLQFAGTVALESAATLFQSAFHVDAALGQNEMTHSP